MEAPSLPRYIPHKSKKRVFPGSSSSFMDPEVIEISPPVNRTLINRSSNSKSLKLKEVICHEIIDVDMEENCGDVMLIDGMVDRNKKGKEVSGNILFGPSTAAKVDSKDGIQSSKKNCASGSQNFLDLDGSNSDLYNFEDDYMDTYADDYIFEDEYAILQSHFDHIDIPPGIEAPIPWLPGHVPIENKPDTAGFPPAYLQKQSDSVFPPNADPSHFMQLPSLLSKSGSSLQAHDLANGFEKRKPPLFCSSAPVKSKKISAPLNSSTYSSPQAKSDGMSVRSGMKPFKAWRQISSSHSKRKPAGPGGSSYYSFHDQPGCVKPSAGVEPLFGPHYLPHSTKMQLGNSSLYSGYPQESDVSNWPEEQPYMDAHSGFFDPLDGVHSFLEEGTHATWVHDPAQSQKSAADVGSSMVPSASSSVEEHIGNDEILKKFENFKKFDTVQDYSDHHYAHNGSSLKQPSKSWAKKIQGEWKILEKDLPDTIFVRVYESRMDLLRAVIVGAEGTPYHDGLFFFDVFFPSSYPSGPPHVHYHSGGLRINPNLYNCGKVCLSLLNTWSGGQKEKWIPGTSTMLQVLVSIQGLILNAKPYFNEPGYAHMGGSIAGENSSLQYNENTFILSLKTMVYTMRKPPKHFEDLVVGHFCKHARDILVACKAYIEGAQVGCLVRGGVQDVDEGDKSCSQSFKNNIASNITTLIKAFAKIGAKDTEQFLPLAQQRSAHATSVPIVPNYYKPW